MHLHTSKRWRSETRNITLCKWQARRQLCTPGADMPGFPGLEFSYSGQGKPSKAVRRTLQTGSPENKRSFWLPGFLFKNGKSSREKASIRTPDALDTLSDREHATRCLWFSHSYLWIIAYFSIAAVILWVSLKWVRQRYLPMCLSASMFSMPRIVPGM